MTHIQDLIDAIPDPEIIGNIATKDTISNLLRIAYCRGTNNYNLKLL
ncbi:hypothetical protein LCGC14_1510830 [marine sediment metagenome]|uniref:Uncharacterized protein n=1 Tax=marine sediment metagenome TaxID=412755 RepID=A0A0F9M2K9_9ZZZZ